MDSQEIKHQGLKMPGKGCAWLAQLEKDVTLDLGVVSLSLTLGVEIT